MYRYYQCVLQPCRADGEKCTNERVDADALEAMLIGEILKAYSASTLFERALLIALENVPDQLRTLQKEGEGIEVNVAKTEAALDRYFVAFEEGSLDSTAMMERTEKLKVRLEEFKAEKRRVAEELAALGETNTSLVDLGRVFDQATHVVVKLRELP